MSLPDLSRYDRVALDTETTGVGYTDRPVGLAWATPDGKKGYIAWGHPAGNNADLSEVREWARRELTRPDVAYVFHNAGFDLRMMYYAAIPVAGTPVNLGARPKDTWPGIVHDTGVMAAILNELEPDLSLDGLGLAYLKESKTGDLLWEWCAREFGGRATRSAQIKNLAKAPVSVVEEYAEQDASLTLRLYDTFAPLLAESGVVRRMDPDTRAPTLIKSAYAPDLTYIYDIERRLIPILVRMHLFGVHVDVPRTHALKRELQAELKTLEERWKAEAGDVNPNSSQQLAVLFKRNGLIVPTTEKGNPSITKDYLAANAERFPLADMVLQLRRLHHYSGTFIDSYILGNVVEGRIHGEFHQVRKEDYGTVSGRFSSGGGLNLQNIPARDRVWAPRIRGLFIPVPGSEWYKLDYSQIEYRFLAHYAGGQLRDAYLADPDVDFHAATAELAGIERQDAKNLNFAIVYGAGVSKVAAMLGCSRDRASQILTDYHTKIPEIRETYNKASNKANKNGLIRTWGERARRFPVSKSGYDYTYRALNALLQGSAADMMKIAMIRVDEILDWEDVVLHLTVHDELDFSVAPTEKGRKIISEVKTAMEDFALSDGHPRPVHGEWPSITVPIRVDLEKGPDWGHVG